MVICKTVEDYLVFEIMSSDFFLHLDVDRMY